jgi:septum formation protein
MPELVLASTSATRQRLLASAGLAFRAVAPEVSEDGGLIDPVARARELASRKARAVAARFPDAWVIGSDQVVWDGVDVFGKPTDPDDHRRRLASLRGRTHELVTAVAFVRGDVLLSVDHDVTRMVVRSDVTDDEIAAYVATGEGRWCAGGYAAEGLGQFLFQRIDGDFSNVLGLPMPLVVARLRALGWRFADGALRA